MHTTQYLDWFVTYREGFNLNTGDKNLNVAGEEPSFTQISMFYHWCLTL